MSIYVDFYSSNALCRECDKGSSQKFPQLFAELDALSAAPHWPVAAPCGACRKLPQHCSLWPVILQHDSPLTTPQFVMTFKVFAFDRR